MKKLTLLFLLLSVLIAGCETTRGAGKDIENTGDNIQEGVGEVTR